MLRAPERVSFEVEEDVAVVRFGQQFEAVTVDRVLGRRHEFIDRRCLGMLARRDLQYRLSAQPLSALLVQFRHRGSSMRQFHERAYAVTLEGVALRGPDVGDVDERVLVAPLRVTDRIELAVVTVRTGFGRGVADLVLVEQRRQLVTEATPVGAELFDAQRLGDARTEPEVHLTRGRPRQRLQRVGVEAELQHVSRLAFDARQLGVHRLVGAVAVRVIDADQEVGDASDAVVDEWHLVDDVVTVVHRIADARGPLRERLVGIATRHLIDASTGVLEFLQAVALVLRALLDEEIGQGTERSRFDDERPRVGTVAQVRGSVNTPTTPRSWTGLSGVQSFISTLSSGVASDTSPV